MKRFLSGFLVYLLALVVVSAVVAPPVYFLVDHFWTGAFPFKRVFNRVLMLTAVVLAWPLAKWWGIRTWKSVGLEWPGTAVATGQMLGGLMLGVASLGLLAGWAVLAGYREPQMDFNLVKFLGHVLSGVLVSLVEEPLFRGVFFLALIAGLARFQVLAVAALGSLFFATAHFVKATDPAGAITWLSGCDVWMGMLSQMGDWQDVVMRWLALFLAGMVLCVAAWKSGTLWIAMGVHTGWVIGLKTAERLTHDLGRPLSLMFGDGLLNGLSASVMLGVLLWMFLKKMPSPHP